MGQFIFRTISFADTNIIAGLSSSQMTVYTVTNRMISP